MTDIPINLVFEDVLSEAVLKEMLKQSQRPFLVGSCSNKKGAGDIKKNLPAYNNAAKRMPYLVLTDLDNADCPLVILSEWLTQPKHPNLLFRIAIKEVEAWLLAHRSAFAEFLGISVDLIPGDVDKIPDPKQLLINLAKKSRKRNLRDAIVPDRNSTAKIGKDYNGQLIQFVNQSWQVASAQTNSPSLQRAMNAIVNFQPTWEN
ncbi:MAG: hypothetical protein JGK03_05100 [Microcoleus sp. PH2017_25_DOB_D_A]|uniref:hypothetical protein n=1 Tax=unclassified Microcoleus TaxID=2642155 RepID=UPI001DC3C9A3|nr:MULTISPECIES: hypothetical protein [unclassified Microcoleus]TAE14675.1 MAG: hypothetical protein EAZ94_06730 [Oscillatoriales cyanobacterium]MCC3470256.1 hypothetical protein [Microcoleus sp. PH2017_13_LAR_U_A]MCC3482983.1 hypothetical protein [Microcoleus sp. PH2017_14_LAR_D_A]MCC3490860.1 hypothetical protein [Microcoleus sp. PH2017_16_JOR_D_A]MCC3497664.1 hypothetical protein [Microcoleus sp. PH2017_15_JOR_U_A]